MRPIVRPEKPSDVEAISKVIELAFLNAPHTNHSEHILVEALRNAGDLTISLVADYRGAVVGHVAISPVSITGDIFRWYGLGPLAVKPEVQRKGVGSDLVREALRELKVRGAAGCVVLGEPAYYARFGFRPEPGLILHGIEPKLFQAVTFVERAPFGIVSYHPAFYA
jgi:putative acetyltransferase